MLQLQPYAGAQPITTQVVVKVHRGQASEAFFFLIIILFYLGGFYSLLSGNIDQDV